MKQEVAATTQREASIMVEYMHLDLSSFDSVRYFVAALTERNQSLHILINNAGISRVPYGERHANCNGIVLIGCKVQLLIFVQAKQKMGLNSIIRYQSTEIVF